MVMVTRTLEQVIDLIQDRSYIDEDTGCWVYTGCINQNGYGVITYRKQQWLVHRLIFNKVIFKELPHSVLHKCDNPPCWNPEHLYGGNDQDNANDRVARNRHNKGVEHYRAALTEDIVQEIRAIENPNYVEIAERYNIDRSAIRKVVLGITWKHVQTHHEA